MPRTRKATAVIPTPSLVASAVRYSGEAARIYRPNQEWQKEAYRHYEICGEARYAANYYGHALSRARLYVAERDKDRRVIPSTDTDAVALLDDLFNGADGQEEMLTAIGIHATVAGECFLVGREVDGQDMWEVVSILEMKVSGKNWAIDYGDGMAMVPLTDNDVVIRIWRPHPARRIEADSPFRSLLPILTEIEWLTRHIFSQVSSRLAGAGILFLSQGMTFPKPPPREPVDGEPPPPEENEADQFMRLLAEGMLQPIEDPSSPAAMVPLVVMAPQDSVEASKLLHFWSELDENSKELREEAIRRFALGMDLPPEEILGMSSNSGTGGGTSTGVSHWGAWQIEESAIKMHVEPLLQLVCNALTVGYLRPLLEEGMATGERVSLFMHFDTSALRLRPDRSKEAGELYDRGELSAKAMRRENGFGEHDKPDDEEFRLWLLKKVASGSATPEQVAAALDQLGVTVPAESETAPREARPDPSLEDHPTRPRTPGENAALLAASDALVWRALERAGNRIRQSAQIKPPNVPSYEMHTLVASNGESDRYLADAWSCAPQVLDGMCDVAETVQSLDSYVRMLFHEKSPHTRARLEQWMSTVPVMRTLT